MCALVVNIKKKVSFVFAYKFILWPEILCNITSRNNNDNDNIKKLGNKTTSHLRTPRNPYPPFSHPLPPTPPANCVDWNSDSLLLKRRKINVNVCFVLFLNFFWYHFVSWILSILNTLHPNIIMHILHTVHHTFLNVLARRIFLTIKRLFSWLSFPLFPWP